MSNVATISVIVPIYNEAPNIDKLYQTLDSVFSKIQQAYELIFINDGSTDDSRQVLNTFNSKYKHVKVLHMARNFGKEIALTAGLNHATGDAALMIDADLQHPPSYIPEFIQKWQNGADVVIGVRKESGKENIIHHIFSVVYYKILGMLSDVPVVPHATDFRLIDRQVIDQFNLFTERNRMLRGLIDWLGFQRDYVYFNAQKRHAGEAAYNTRKLIKLAVNSFVSVSQTPLKFATWLGSLIIITMGPLGLIMLFDKYLLNNHSHFTPASSLSVFILFLVGIILVGMGLMGLYVASIHNEVSNRPLYVIRKDRKPLGKAKY